MSKPKPEIFVVVPLYNKAQSVRRAINSILAQSFQDFEVLVIDDGSSDSSAEVVSSIHDERISLLQQENRGVSATRNRGIDLANCERIAFLDADDEWKPGYLESILQLINKYPQVGAYATSYEMLWPGGSVQLPKFSHRSNLPEQSIITNLFGMALPDMPFYTSSIVVREEAIQAVGKFPVGINLYEDIDTWTRLALKYPIAFDKSAQVVYHLEAENRACLTNFHKGDVPIARTAFKAIDEGIVSGQVANDLYEFVTRHQLIAANHCLRDSNRKCALEILESIRKTRRFRLQWLWWYLWAVLPAGAFQTASKMKHDLVNILGKGR
jgi:glycosyltransferase involved in cell wall biosynthesis